MSESIPGLYDYTGYDTRDELAEMTESQLAELSVTLHDERARLKEVIAVVSSVRDEKAIAAEIAARNPNPELDQHIGKPAPDQPPAE